MSIVMTERGCFLRSARASSRKRNSSRKRRLYKPVSESRIDCSCKVSWTFRLASARLVSSATAAATARFRPDSVEPAFSEGFDSSFTRRKCSSPSVSPSAKRGTHRYVCAEFESAVTCPQSSSVCGFWNRWGCAWRNPQQSRRMNDIQPAVRALKQLRAETFYGRVDFGRRRAGPEIPAQFAKRDVLNMDLFQVAGLIGVHASQARDRGFLGFSFFAFFGFLDRAIERRRKLGEAGCENVIGRRVPARFGRDFLAVGSGDENERRIGAQGLRLCQCDEPAELRHGSAVENRVRNGELYLPCEILGRLDAPCLERDPRADQHEDQ